MNQTSVVQASEKAGVNATPVSMRKLGKYEILDGKMIAKPPANRSHNVIASNFVIAVGSRFQRGSCELYGGGIQVKIGKNSICLPDVVVVQGDPEIADENEDLLLNPTIVVEIFSSLTSSTDRTQRLEGFLAVPKLKECVLVNQSDSRIEHYARQNQKQWIYRIYDERDDVICLDSINCKLSLAEVYSQTRIREPQLASATIN